MKMKRTVSFLLALVMLLGLFAGCGQQGGEAQPGTEPQAGQEATQTTEPEVKDPPRTAEDFIAQLSDVLKVQNIPVELVLEQDEDYSQDSKFAVYVVHLTNGNGNYGALRIVLYYSKTESETLSNIQIIRYDEATEQEREVYPVLSGIASALCDEAMTEAMVEELFAAEPAQSWYATYSGDIGSFTEIREANYPEGVEHTESSVVFRQPGKLTHSILLEHITFQKETRDLMTYEITFAGTEECFFADNIISFPDSSVSPVLTLAELETFINGFFAEREIPIECVFQMWRREDSYRYIGDTIVSPNEGSVLWDARFRFTDLDDPDFVYPEVSYTNYNGSDGPEKEKYRALALNMQIPIGITTYTNGFYYDAPISSINCSINPGEFYDPYITESWDEIWYDWAQQMIEGLGVLWSAETENDSAVNFLSEELDKGTSERDSEILTDDFVAFLDVYDVGMRLQMSNSAISSWYYPDPDALDPNFLDYQFSFDKPIVQNGVFADWVTQPWDDNSLYRTDPYGAGTVADTHLSILAEYMGMSASNITLEYTGYGELVEYSPRQYQRASGFARGGIGGGYDEILDMRYFGVFFHDVEDLGDQMYMFYYNPKVDCPEEYEDVLHAPIGISQILDEDMTVEEAIALHTQPRETALTFGDWQLSYYAPREVTHIHCENIVTGQILYFVLPYAVFEAYFGSLEAFSESAMTITRYEAVVRKLDESV